MASIRLDPDMRAIIDAQHLCFAATVTPDGKPHCSPKGTIRVYDDTRLCFCDIASPGTRANLAANPWIELNVVDTTSRRGYRFLGTATLHRGDDVYRRATEQIFGEEGETYPVEAVVLVSLTRIQPVVSPGYWHAPDEWAMRAQWKERRPPMDAAFEAHVRRRGPWKEKGGDE
jgi:predicted pyridoxine 5'-phosphate oxidase superfamily flavin-nucleotide-binding protein